MSSGYRDLRLWCDKASNLITNLGIKRGEVEAVEINGMAGIEPRIRVEAECFVRLCRETGRRPTISRNGDFLHGQFKVGGFIVSVVVWSKSECTDFALHWQAINSLAKPMLESPVRPRIGVHRPAIADRRRLIGLPAPKIVEVIDV